MAADKVMGLPGGRGSPVKRRDRDQGACPTRGRGLRLGRVAASTASPPTRARAAARNTSEAMRQPGCPPGSPGRLGTLVWWCQDSPTWLWVRWPLGVAGHRGRSGWFLRLVPGLADLALGGWPPGVLAFVGGLGVGDGGHAGQVWWPPAGRRAPGPGRACTWTWVPPYRWAMCAVGLAGPGRGPAPEQLPPAPRRPAVAAARLGDGREQPLVAGLVLEFSRRDATLTASPTTSVSDVSGSPATTSPVLTPV
jgi:hypothetical protein